MSINTQYAVICVGCLSLSAYNGVLFFLTITNLIAAYNFSISSGDSPVTSAIISMELPFIFSL